LLVVLCASLAWCALTARGQDADEGMAVEDQPPPAAPQPDTENPDKPADAKKGAEDLGAEESIARLQQLLEKRPLHAAALNDLARHYADKGKLADLVKEYEQKITALKDDVKPRIVLARLYLRAGEPAKAAEIVAQITELPP